MIKVLYAFFIGMVFLVLSIWIAYPSVISLVQGEDIQKISFGYIALFAIFSLIGISLTIVIVAILSLVKRTVIRLDGKFLYIPAIAFGVLGLGVNHANYYYVIKPNSMSECPPQIGYKKNLMRDYVTDISLCEKF